MRNEPVLPRIYLSWTVDDVFLSFMDKSKYFYIFFIGIFLVCLLIVGAFLLELFHGVQIGVIAVMLLCFKSVNGIFMIKKTGRLAIMYQLLALLNNYQDIN